MNLKNTLIGIDGLKAKGKLDIDIKGIESNCDKIEERLYVCSNKRNRSRWS